MGTKGTWRRPAAVDDKELADSWSRTFGSGPSRPLEMSDIENLDHWIRTGEVAESDSSPCHSHCICSACAPPPTVPEVAESDQIK